MTQIGYVCKECGSTILEEKIDLLIDAEIASKDKEINECNKIELEEQKKELAEIAKELKYLHKTKYPKYDYKYDSEGCSLHTGKTWHVFKQDEVCDFSTYTKLFVAKCDNKIEAYFLLSPNWKYKTEDRYVLCPLCNTKNYLPLKQMCLR